MKQTNDNLEKRIRVRILLLSLAFLSIILFVLIVSLNGGGDSRFLPNYVLQFSSLTIITSLFYLLYRIRVYSSLLKDRFALQQTMYKEKDEYTVFLHDKSGGDVWTVIFVLSTIISVLTGEYSKEAFFASIATTYCILIVKIIFYIYYRFFYRE